MKEARDAWHTRTLTDVRADQLVFIDESGCTTAMQRTRGRSPRGERCVATEPGGHWRTCTMVGAVRVDGPLVCSSLDAPMNEAAFVTWVREHLAPYLRPGDMVVMDNLSAHKSPRVRRLIEAASARLAYLPPYSPDLNPIENMWSKVKQHIRTTAARALDKLGEAIGRAVATVTTADCRAFFANCGYAI